MSALYLVKDIVVHANAQSKDLVRPRKDVAVELGKDRTLSLGKDAEQAKKRWHLY